MKNQKYVLCCLLVDKTITFHHYLRSLPVFHLLYNHIDQRLHIVCVYILYCVVLYIIASAQAVGKTIPIALKLVREH